MSLCWAAPAFAVDQPHGGFTRATARCGLCHVLHASPGADSLVASNVTTTCYACHDGSGSTLNTQASFGTTAAPAVSAHPVRTGVLACDSCHTPHRGPSEGNPRSLDATGTHVAAGVAFCGSCHGVGSALPGGNIAGVIGSTPHGSKVATPASGTGITCLACHQPHGSSNVSLLATRVVDTRKTTQTVDAALSPDPACEACHEQASATSSVSYVGSGPWSASAHGPGSCGACHAVHGTGTGLTPAADGSKCLDCHGGAGAVGGNDIAAAFNAGDDTITHHDSAPGVYPGESGLKCTNCHNPHTVTAAQPVSSPYDIRALLSSKGPAAPDSVNVTEADMRIPIIADATISSDDPETNYGQADNLLVDGTHRAILRPDTSLLPPDAYITSAELMVYAPYADRADPITPHVVTESDWDEWGEGSGGNAGAVNGPMVNGVTWLERWYGDNLNAPSGYPVTPDWTTPGGDTEQQWSSPEYSPDGYGPFAVSAFGTTPPGDDWVSLDVSVMMRARQNRYYNNNSSILLTADAGGLLDCASLQAADPSHQPYVLVHYYVTTLQLEATDVRWDGNDLLASFDLSGIPDGATITDTKLAVWGTFNGDPEARDFTVSTVTGDWASGGGYSVEQQVAPYSRDEYNMPFDKPQWLGFQRDDMVAALRDGATGLVITRNGTPVLSTEGRDGASIILEVQYSQDGDAAGSPNGIDFCISCHNGETPAGVGPVPEYGLNGNKLGDAYMSVHSHGYGFAKGTGSRPGFDWNATLKAPYFYGMGPLPCTECHDPHGSSNVYHLKENINGQTGLRVTDPNGNDSQDVEEWCGACHDMPDNHEWWGTDCLGCHSHGRVTGRRM